MRGSLPSCRMPPFLSNVLLVDTARWPWRAASQRWLWIGLFVTCFLFGLVYHISVWQNHPATSTTWALLYEVSVVVGYVALAVALNAFATPRHIAPARTFWTAFLMSVLFVLTSAIINAIGPAESFLVGLDGVASGADNPATFYALLKNNLLGVLEGAFAAFLLVRLRGLVLFKRTRASHRNWRLMLLFMGIAALSTFGLRPESADSYLLHHLLVVPAVALMIVNAFRLSWIAFLSFREKMACIGLSLMLLITLGVAFGSGAEVIYGYVGQYSYPLRVVVVLSMTFGIIYSLTALLSLLFHLPTTSDFQQKAGEIAAMHTLTHLSNDVFDRDRLAARIVASAVDAGTAQSAWLATAESTSGAAEPQILATHGQLSAERVASCVNMSAFYEELIRTQEPVLLDEAIADHRIHARSGDQLNSLLVLPLRARDHMLGALFVAKEVAYGFERDDIEAVSVYAAQAALAFDNAQLFEEQLEKERLARELAIARDVQKRLLPDCLPQADGLSLCASSVSAQEVGGDYYDFLRLDDDHMAVIIADVSGKGSSAAFYMAELQGIFRALSPLAPSPADFLTHANRALASALERHVFVSVIYGVLDLKEETFTFARAGHCPVAIVRHEGVPELLRPKGLGLGLDTGPLFRKTLEVKRIELAPGDAFVLYTDGLIESRNDASEQYGYDRLLEALGRHRHENAEPLHDALVADLSRFVGQKEYDDDMTMTVLKWHGAEVPAEGTPATTRAVV